MSAIQGSIAEVRFSLSGEKRVLDAIPLSNDGNSAKATDVAVSFVPVSRTELPQSISPAGKIIPLYSEFLLPDFIGCCVQTVPLMLSPEVFNSLDDIFSVAAEHDTSLLLAHPAVEECIASCADHASEVLLIIHALTVEVRDFKRKKIDVFYLAEIEHMLYSQFAFEGYRRMFAAFLHCFSSVMVHSSAVIRNGKVLLFAAPDEGGKTTAALLEPSGKVLCDDRNILKATEKGVSVFGTTWGNNFTPELSGELAGIFLLDKAASFALSPLPSRDAAVFMWQDNRHFWSQLPVGHRTGVFDLLLSCCSNVPVAKLSFHREFIDWDSVDSFLESR